MYEESAAQKERHELYLNLLASVLCTEPALIQFPQLGLDAQSIVETRAVQMLMSIREILRDERMDDPECFWRIEEIVRVFEENGLGCGLRHDF